MKTKEDNETKQRRVKQPGKFSENSNESRRWTLKEKEKLLKALYKHGHLDIEKIQSEILSRSEGSIRSAIGHYKKIARSVLNKNPRVSNRFFDEDILNELKSPMLQNTEKWTSLMKSILEDRSNIQYGMSNIFLVLAEVGDFPPPELCDGVDFREVYMCMHAIINGHPCKDVSIKTAAYMFDCFNRMQVASNKLGHNREKAFLEEMYDCRIPSTREYFIKKSETQSKEDTVVLERMLEIPDANPLKIPMELLVRKQRRNHDPLQRSKCE